MFKLLESSTPPTLEMVEEPGNDLIGGQHFNSPLGHITIRACRTLAFGESFHILRLRATFQACRTIEANTLHASDRAAVLNSTTFLTTDYYDGGDRYSRPRLSVEDSVLTRLQKDFVALADLVRALRSMLT